MKRDRIQKQQLKKFEGLTPLQKKDFLREKLTERARQIRYIYPMSHSQRAIYLAYQSDPKSSAYNVAFSATIRSGLNVATLKSAFNKLIQRHPSLRTIYFFKGGEPFQEIHLSSELAFFQFNAENWPEEELKVKVKEDYNRPINLEKGPVSRVSLYNCGHDHYVLLFVIHHISCDAWSLMLLLEDLEGIYAADQEKRNDRLEPMEWEYLDYVKTQNLLLTGKKYNRLKNYWLKRLPGDTEGTQISLDHARSSVITFNGSSVHFELPAELHLKLKKIAQKEKATLFIVLLAAFNVLLYKYTGRDKLQFATSDAGRRQNQWQRIVGHFVNLVVLRSDLSDTHEFSELVRKLQGSFLQDYSHNDFPFPLLVKELKVPRVASVPPLVQIVFSMLRVREGSKIQQLQKPGNNNMKINWAGLELEHFPLSQQEGQFDLTLNLIEDSEGISGTLKFNTDLFESSTIERMCGHYRTILEDVAQNPSQLLTEISYLTPEEEKEELTVWNPTPSTGTEADFLHGIFEKQAANFPNRTAVICGKESLTYHDMNLQANRLAHYLRELGAGPEVPVGILLDRSIEVVVAIIAVMKSGSAFLPLDPTLPEKRLNHMIMDSNTQMIISFEQHAEKIPKGLKHVIYLDSDEVLIRNQPDKNPELSVGPDNLVYILYTSGSTGLPKGVLVEHNQLTHYHRAIMKKMDLEGGLNFVSPASINADHVYTVVFGALCTGGILHILPYDIVMDPSLMGAYFSEHRIDCLKITPSYLTALLTVGMGAGILPEKYLIIGGEAFSTELLVRIKSLKPKCTVYNHYGPTETTIGSSLFQVDVASKNTHDKTVPIGSPLPNSKIYLLDSSLRPIPKGIPGEIYIGGKSVARGYLRRPELTKERFIQDPFSHQPEDRMYKTGDLARRLPDGTIEFIGRIDKQVKIRGYRVEPEESKIALEEYDGIAQAIVIVKSKNNDSPELVAYVVPTKDKEDLSTSGMLKFLTTRLPNYLIPSAIIILDKIPLNATGKIDYGSLPERHMNMHDTQYSYFGPRNEKEKKIVNIWQQVLKVKKISIYDNFFHLGGDSINCLQIISKARNSGLFFTARQIFQYPTIAGLAEVTDTSFHENEAEIVAEGTLPLIPVQKWFFEHYGNFPHYYNQSVLLKTQRNVSPTEMLKALEIINNHHKALLLRFKFSGGNWEQYYLPEPQSVHFEMENIDKLSDKEIKARINKVSEELHAGLNISEGPVMKSCLFFGSEKQSSFMLIDIHHLVVDTISWNILLQDLFIIYEQLAGRESVVLPLRSDTYKSWALKLNSYAESDKVKGELDFWTRMNRKPLFKLPVDYVVPPDINIFSGEKHFDIHLNKKWTTALLENSSQAYHTLVSDLQIVALYQAFYEWTGDPRLLLLLEGHGREDLFEDTDISRTVGWFTSKYPVLLKLDKASDFENSILSVKEQLRQIPGKGIGYGLLRYLSKDQDIRNKMAEIPEPEVVFNFLGKVSQNPEHVPWELQNKAMGAIRGPNLIRAHLIEIVGMIIGGELRLQWIYQPRIHKHSTIASVGRRSVDILIQLIDHCVTRKQEKYTPSDFPDAGLAQAQLDKLIAKLENS